ncbi:trifunctional MMPL family transporter/lysophospholipid acyltransferase/class I SAM-dependent methyltransferase [Aureispira anguillae]|uniref:1-acyl-sn-glycerol-3-phosphate acyltransferase n=1 Tax=Aureispira anguillae TaxID=2864201 RepID=A0A915YLS3_9BACT|nr:trifunctional MMPL family transporter/lysophospholipid acyltransferase/class I SAM-dependent methyltransferase [Aureispira anguillae]BDS15568.1 1-acyl-sn-glycerol-3-phosphate acyltransferase [Aureispira anguillae]
MASFFTFLYHYFQQRKLFLAILVSGFLVASLWLIASQLKLNEDIAKVIPLDANIQKVNQAYQNTKFSDNLIFHLSPTDTASFDRPAALIDFADSLVASLGHLDSNKIQEIRYTLSDAAITQLYDLFYEHLPLFLAPKDYEELANRLDSTGIQKSLRSVYKTLLSPAGFVLKKNVIKDPLGLASLPLRNLQDFQIDGNYILHNNRIMTKDKKHLLFFVTPKANAGATGENAILLAQIDKKIAATQAQFEDKFEAEYFGSIAVSVANAEQIKTDISYTVGAALIALILFIALFFKRLSIPILIFIPVVLGAAMGLATLVLVKDSISAISLGVGAVLLGITVDFSLHVFAHFRSEGAVKKTIQDISTPTIMSSLTTSSAFLCLLYMSSEAMRDLGIFAAVAVLASAVSALVVLPHFLPKTTHTTNIPKDTFLDRLAAYPIHKNKWIKGGVALATFFFLFFFNKVQFEDDMNNINFMPPALKTADQNLQQMGGEALKSTYVVSTASDMETALRRNEKASRQLQQLKEKGSIQNYTSVSKFLLSQEAQAEKIAAWNHFWTPERKTALKQTLVEQGNKFKFKATTFNQFSALLEKEFKPVSIDRFSALQELLLSEYSTFKNGQYSFISIVKLEDDQKATVYPLFQADKDITIFDKQFIADQFAQSLQKDFSTLVNWSFLIVLIILLIAFGRIELALLTIFPILLSWEWTLGLMALIGLKFNVVNIIICTFIFGLGIDYSIFVTKGLLHEYKYGERILPTYKTSIILSALTTMCGMGVMIFAQHPALFSIASLSIIGILSILVITFTIQPLIFGVLILNRKAKGLPPYTLLNIISTVIAYTHFLSGCLILTLLTFTLTISPFQKELKKYLLHRVIRLFSASLIHLMFNVRKIYINKEKLQLNQPALIIANHQSFLDIMMILMLHPKIIIMTNSWVWNSPIFGRVIRFADFYPSDAGAENSIEQLQKLTDKGYSIMVFPEGTRSKTGKISRFKKGAFYIAEQLNLDILPIVFHGTGDCIRKNDFLVHGTTVTMKFLDRISPTDSSWGNSYSERTKSISKYFKQEFQQIKEATETADFFEDRLIKNYIYKGPVLEWYTRIKVRLEDKYRPFDALLPKKATITDIGCGYGMMPYMLHLLSNDRIITGIDYDAEKILVANEAFLKNDKINFVAADATQYPLTASDVFLISDMLHYIPKAAQHQLIRRCLDQLNEGGMLIIRDGDADLKERHEGTVWTEKFSTQIFGFNKTIAENLTFLSGKEIEKVAGEYNLTVERLDLTQKTSNIIFIIKKHSVPRDISKSY